jgi:hypothetical protein
MAWTDTFNDVFWITIGTLTFSFFGVVLKSCLKSKCDNTNLCWGMVSIHRRVELEDDVEMQNSVKKQESQVNAT